MRHSAGSLRDRRYAWPTIVVAVLALGAAIPALNFAGGLAASAREVEPLGPATRSWGVDWTPRAAGVAAVQAIAAARLAKLVAGAGAVAIVIAVLTLWAVAATRAEASRAEWVIRRALGASRRMLVSEGLREGAWMAATVLLSSAVVGAIATTVMKHSWPGTPSSSRVGLDHAALATAMFVALWIVLLAVAPFVARHPSASLATPPVARRGLVVPGVQLGVALAVLLAAARLAGSRDLDAMRSEDGVGGVVYRIAAPEGHSAAQRAELYGTLLDRLTDDPTIGAVAVASPGMFLGLGTTDLAITDCGACSQGGLPAPFHPIAASYHLVSPDTFEAVGVPIVAGRGIRRDEGAADPVAIVSRTLAERHFEGDRAVGRRIRVGKSPGSWHLVVGVAEDREAHALGATASTNAVYLSALQHPAKELQLLVSAESDGSAVRRALRELLGPAAVREPIPMPALWQAALRPARWLAVALTIEGGIALLLAAYGVAVVAALTAGRRRPEYALRRAVGARGHDIRRLAYGETGRAVLLGLALGWWLDLLTAGLVTSAAGPGFTPSVWVVIALVTLLAFAAFAGASGPIRRAVLGAPGAALEPDH